MKRIFDCVSIMLRGAAAPYEDGTVNRAARQAHVVHTEIVIPGKV